MHNPLEQFEIKELFTILVLGAYKLSLTNIGLYLLIVTGLIISIMNTTKGKVLTDKWTLITEGTYDSVLSIVRDQIGSKNERYLPLIYSLFIFILFSNLIGLIPYSFTPTSHIVLTLSISIAIFLGVTILGLQIHKWEFFSLFIPVGTPLALVPFLAIIELISYLARALSLGIRLGANI